MVDFPLTWQNGISWHSKMAMDNPRFSLWKPPFTYIYLSISISIYLYLYLYIAIYLYHIYLYLYHIYIYIFISISLYIYIHVHRMVPPSNVCWFRTPRHCWGQRIIAHMQPLGLGIPSFPWQFGPEEWQFHDAQIIVTIYNYTTIYKYYYI